MEVANLLTSIHHNYFNDVEENNVLRRLMKLLYDLNLTEALSILDVERIRLKVMKWSNSLRMNYESFYEFLKEASEFIYKKFDESGNLCDRSWNLLLSQIIIPFATKERVKNLSEMSFFSLEHILPDESSLKVMLPYGNFLHLWFSSRNFCDELRLSPSYDFDLRLAYQAQPSHSLDIIGLDKIFDTLKSCDIFTEELDEDGIFFTEKVLVATIPRDIIGTGNYFNCLGFPDFLNVVENIAKKVSLSEVQSLGLGLTISTKLVVLLQMISSKLLNLKLNSFAAYEMGVVGVNDKAFQRTANVKTGCNNNRFGLPSISSSISVTSVLWICRQSGVTHLPGLSLNTLLNELIARSDASQLRETSTTKTEKTHAWSLTHLPQSICQIVEIYTQHKIGMVGGLTGISSPGRTALILAQLKPEIFFISPTVLPILKPFYTEECIRALHEITPAIDAFFEYTMVSAIHTMKSTTRYKIETITFREFNQIFENSCVVPHLISSTMILEICEYMMGFNLEGSAADIRVVKNDWIEILYVIAQTCFENNTNENGSGHKTETKPLKNNDGNGSGSLDTAYEAKAIISFPTVDNLESNSTFSIQLSSSKNQLIQKLLDLLRCLKSISSLPYIRGTVRKGDDLHIFLKKSIKNNWVFKKEPESQLFLRSLFRETDIEHSSSKSSRSLNIQKASKPVLVYPSHALALDSRVKEEGGTRGSSGFSLREVMILLVHFPLNNFDLNPWNMFEILSVASGPSIPIEPPSTTHTVSIVQNQNGGNIDDTRYRMAKIFQSFCAQYRVPSADLTKYFASFYKEESSVAETSRTIVMPNVEKQEEGCPAPNVHNPISTKKITVKLAVQGVLKSSVFDLLFTEKIHLLLHNNADLLRWEFSRASSLCRSSDPFTKDLTVPFISLHTMRITPDDSKITLMSAITWAEEMAEVSRDEALLQLKRTALLSGEASVTSDYQLTFSVFLIYAIHCFSAHALLSTTGTFLQDEIVFESCLKKMMQRSSFRLGLVCHSLQLGVDIIEAIYGVSTKMNGVTSVKEIHLSAADKLILIRHALLSFNEHKNKR